MDKRGPFPHAQPESGHRRSPASPLRRVTGLVIGTGDGGGLAPEKLRQVQEVLDQAPLLPPDVLALLRWAWGYYHHPPGEVVAAALPAALRAGAPLPEPPSVVRGAGAPPEALARRAPKQAALLEWLLEGPRRTDDPDWPDGWRPVLRRLQARGLVDVRAEAPPDRWDVPAGGPELSAAQSAAVDAVAEDENRFAVHLLFGVTGSGKTEVYLAAVARALRAGRQALVLVPEIALTPQLVQRFRSRLSAPVAVLHSGLAAGERLRAWADAASGRAAVVIGTRSAVFTPLARPGLFVVDEEHDPSLRQQEGFHYSARDVAVMRASRAGVPVVLGSATPSLESLNNALEGRYRILRLPTRAGQARPPRLRLVDLRRHPARDGLSGPLLTAMDTHLGAGGQVMLFLNRRGYAPALFCSHCGWVAGCLNCDARMTYHRGAGRLRCHHCGAEDAVPATCPECCADLRPVGEGTQRLEETLARRFPGAALARIDRDSTRNRGSVARILDDVRAGRTRILVGTQMMAKGHDFPGVTLVGVVNADQGLFGTDFRAGERLAQTLVQVAGRAGRADRPGEVLIQTAYPEHPLLQRLLEEGYEGFATGALEERREAGWPPFSHLALLRADASKPGRALDFLSNVRDAAGPCQGVTILGPAPAPMERRGGRWRAQLLLQARSRQALHAAIVTQARAAEEAGSTGRVRWSLEIDPQELF
ncbi:MAG: primosomal protein N' [Gammaproteobacteria bacterium]